MANFYPLFDPRSLRRDKDFYYEIIKQGNARGDDGNWGFAIDSNNDLVFYVKVSGSWKIAGKREKPA